MPGDTAGTSPSGVGSSSIIAASGAAVAAGGSATPTLNLAGVQIPYSLISLVTLTVQNSALTILLHYSRTAPNAKPYSAAAAVLLNEILKGSISSAIALSNIDSSSANVSSAAFARYNGGIPGDSSSTGGPSAASAAPGLHEKRASVSHRKRNESLGFGQEEAWHKRNGLGVARPPQRAWWLDFRHWLFRLQKLRSLVFSADCWKLGVPACCYVLQNNLQFVAATNLDVATFQVSYQMKILTTAFFSVTMLRKRLSVQKWLCLLGLASGVAVVQLQGTAATGGSASGHADMDRFTGFVAVVMACMTSGFAGVYFEKVLKGANADLWVRNIQLTLFSLPPALLAALFPDLSIRDFVSGPGSFADNRIKIVDPDAPTWLFGNFGFWALATVFCQVFGGLVTALVIRYSDNIAKGFATSLSIILSFIAGIILFNFQVTTPFLVGCSMVLAATWFYNQPEAEPVSRLRQGTYRPVNTVPPETRNGHAHGHIRDQSHSYAVEITSSPGLRRHAQGSDAGSVGGDDPAYPYASYPATSSQPPKFVNVSPFGATQGVSSPPPFLQEESVSPKSPVPPFLEGSPFGGGASAPSKES